MRGAARCFNWAAPSSSEVQPRRNQTEEQYGLWDVAALQRRPQPHVIVGLSAQQAVGHRADERCRALHWTWG